MDTIKDKQELDALVESGDAPWRRASPPTRPLMLELSLWRPPSLPVARVLAIGCHADDIEIGCGGTILALTRTSPGHRGDVGRARGRGERAPRRRGRARRRSSRRRRRPTSGSTSFRDGFLPYVGGEVKEVFEGLKAVEPDLVLTHTRTTCTRIIGSPAS